MVALPGWALEAHTHMSDLVSIDLAPTNPYSLIVHSPLLLAPGCNIREIDHTILGAIITRTATRHTRGGPVPQFAPTPAGLLVTGFPTLGLRTLLKQDARRWQRATLPIIASLQGTARDLAEMAAILEGNEGVAALLLNAEDDPVRAVAAVRAQTPRPLLVTLPYHPDPAQLAQAIVQAGADALVVSDAPDGAALGDPPLTGALLGPAIYPVMLHMLIEVRASLEVPLIACGGIVTPTMAQAVLNAGATAFMIDAPRWGDIAVPARIAAGLPMARPRSIA